jgi:hypothetical protein
LEDTESLIAITNEIPNLIIPQMKPQVCLALKDGNCNPGLGSSNNECDLSNVESSLDEINDKLGQFPFNCNTPRNNNGFYDDVSEALQSLTCGGIGGNGANEVLEDLLDEKDRTDEILDKLDDILNNAEFTVNVFDELKDVASGYYLAFRMMDVTEESFPKRKKDITTYPYTLSNARPDITLEELKAIEWHRGTEYCWVNPKGVKSKGKLKRGYFSDYGQAQVDLKAIYDLTTFKGTVGNFGEIEGATAPEFGRSEKTNPQVTPDNITTKIIQACLYNVDTDEIEKVWQSVDFEMTAEEKAAYPANEPPTEEEPT